jgi:hypothetical protein
VDQNAAVALLLLGACAPLAEPPAVLTPDVDARRAEFGFVVTEEQLAGRVSMRSIFLGIPKVRIVGSLTAFQVALAAPLGGICEPTLYIDGRRAQQYELLDFRPQQIAAVQVYPRPTTAPVRYQGVSVVTAGDVCGAVLVWTKTLP